MDLSQIATNWILSLIDLDGFEQRHICEPIKRDLQKLESIQLRQIGDVSKVKNCLQDIANTSNEWIIRLNTEFNHEEIYQRGLAAWEAISRSVDEESLNELASIKTPVEELEEIGKLINTPQLAFLPTWVWKKMGAYSDGDIDMGDIAHCLTKSANRSLIRSCMSIIIPAEKKHRHLLDEIKGLSPTDDLGNLPELIKERINELTYYIANKLKSTGLAAFQVKFEKLGISNEQCDEFCDVLESVHQELSHETSKDLNQALLQESSFQNILSKAEFYKHGANKLSEYVAFSTMAFEQIRSTAEKQKTFKKQNQKEETETNYVFDIRHDIVEENRKVSLTYSKYDDENVVYGFVQFPLKITSTKGERTRFDLTYSISSQLTTQWPAEWDSPGPTKGLGAYGDWKRDDSGRLYTSVHVKIPLRKPTKGVSKNIEIKVNAINPLTNEALGSYNCQWGDIQETSDRIKYNWADSIRTEWVDEHPVGPQIRASSILDKVEAGNSFAVIAPRRFGKSTLAKYIEERSRKLGVLACTITCTEFVSDSGAVNYDAIWRTISTNIGKAIGAQISYDQQFTFPNEDEFDFARIQAKQSGYKNITLIFDEAQLLFRNAAAGSRFKGLLEMNWSQDTSSKTPICFGFLGLPSLRERGGRDLMGLLRPIEKMEFDEENLSKLLKKLIHSSLSSTSASRQFLVKNISNLYLLKEVLEDTIEKLNREKRTWITINDVTCSFNNLTRDLESGGAQTAADYIQDVFNSNEDMNRWRPVACYPVGVALAYIQSESVNLGTTIDRAQQQLNLWCGSSDDTEESTIYKYTKSKIEEHLNNLRDLKVYDKNKGFLNILYLAWLKSRADGFPRQEEINSLRLGAMPCVVIPNDCTLVGEGDQAQVFWFEKAGIEYGCRKALLTAADYNRFVDSIDMFNDLKTLVSNKRGDSATRHIFELTNIGISSDYDEGPDCHAVQIYKWIDGTSLDKKAGKLGFSILIEIAQMTARAIKFLHQHGILHRDISPSNIIWEEEFNRPVLIDFGMAQLTNRAMTTFAQSGFAAPEVRTDNPTWTSKADVYAFGKTIQELLSPEENRDDLNQLLAKCLEADPEKRISIKEATEGLEQLSESHKLNENIESMEAELVSIAQKESADNWFIELLTNEESNKPLIYSQLGISHDHENLISQLASFVSVSAETYGRNEGLSYSGDFYNIWDIYHDTSSKYYKDDDISYIALLRNSWAHSAKEKLNRFVARKKLVRDIQKIEMFKRGVHKISEELEIKGLKSIVLHCLSI